MITFESFGVGPIDSGIITHASAGRDPFRRFGREVTVPAYGMTISSLNDLVAQGVGEGGVKNSSGSTKAVIVGANKIQSTIVLTEEALTNASHVEEAIFESFPSAISKATTNITAGLTAIPTGWSNFGVFAGAGFATATISTGEDASVDLDDALALIGTGVTAIVLSTSMLAYLKRQRNSVSGTRVFEIDSETIDGIPYATFVSAEKKAVAGDFSDFVYGSTPLVDRNGDVIRVYDQGAVTDVNGLEHNLTSENKFAFRYEELTSSGILSTGSFVLISADAS